MNTKIALSTILLTFCVTLNLSAKAATLNGFTLNAASGSTGTISSVFSGQKNVHYVNPQGDTFDVEQVNGQTKTILYHDVTDLSSSVTGLVNNGAGGFSINASVWDKWDSIYIALKQSNNFSIFLITEKVLSGSWSSTCGPNTCTGLSHYLAFSGAPNISSVPVPAAVWLFGSGIVSMLSLKRRKTA